ncbi:MAG: hypothetical protein ACFFD3_05075 [Candidatus Thorarchaeota archaeon]
MEPLGTITMYYQFLDREIVDILDGFMKEAKDYRDFCERLVEYVVNEDVATELAYLAGVHVWNIGSWDLGSRLRPKFGNTTHMLGWIWKTRRRECYESLDKWAEVVLSESYQDWIKPGICYEITNFTGRFPILEESKYLNMGMEIIQANPKLECFLSYLLDSQGMMNSQEGRLRDAISCLEEGVRVAEKYDDRYQASILLFHLGRLKISIDANASWKYFEESYRAADSIGHIQGAAFATLSMGHVAFVRGEYDLANQSYFRHKEMCVNAGVWDGDRNALYRARAYYSMREGQDALVWAETAIQELSYADGTPIPETVIGIIEKARALIQLGRLNKASELLANAKKTVLEDGREDILGLFKYASGLLEVFEGRTLEGISDLEEAFDIFEQSSSELLVVPCLVDLVRAEVQNYDISGDLDTSGPWMTKLEQRARERDYPGILMEHALLKAEFQMKQGSSRAAKKTLTDALNIYDSPSVKTLRKRIADKLQSLMIDA